MYTGIELVANKDLETGWKLCLLLLCYYYHKEEEVLSKIKFIFSHGYLFENDELHIFIVFRIILVALSLE